MIGRRPHRPSVVTVWPPHMTVSSVDNPSQHRGPARQALLLTKALAGTFRPCSRRRAGPGRGSPRDPDVEAVSVPLVRRSVSAMTPSFCRHPSDGSGSPSDAGTHAHAKAGSVGRAAAMTMRPRPVSCIPFTGNVSTATSGASLRKAFLRVERLLASRTDVLVAVSPEIRDSYWSLVWATPSSTESCQSASRWSIRGCTDRGLLRRQLGVHGGHPLVGAVVASPNQGLGTLLRAIQMLPEVPRLLVGGESSVNLRASPTRSVSQPNTLHGLVAECRAGIRRPRCCCGVDRNEGTPVALIGPWPRTGRRRD